MNAKELPECVRVLSLFMFVLYRKSYGTRGGYTLLLQGDKVIYDCSKFSILSTQDVKNNITYFIPKAARMCFIVNIGEIIERR